MSSQDTALAWARSRARGVLRLPPGSATPKGMRRLVGAGLGKVWAVPAPPEAAGPRAVADLGLPAPGFDKPTEAAQVLACCLRCCWTGPHDPIWPGRAVTVDQVTSVFEQITPGRRRETLPRAVRPALRQLDWTGWVLHQAGSSQIRLGPRVSDWNDVDLNSLRDLWRMMPAPVGEETSA